MLRRSVLTATMVLLASSLLAAETPLPLERADLDRRTAIAVYETTTIGSQIYNKGNHEGCYRIYQGTLIAIQPLLDHRPKLADRVKTALERARGMRSPVEAAFVLREVLDAVQHELTGGKPLPIKELSRPDVKKEPLWERLGGEKAVRAVIHDFVVTAVTNPKVNFTRGGKYPLDARGLDRLEQRIVEMVSAATAGPLKYTGKDMADAHKGMAIKSEEFAAMAEDLRAALKKFAIPQGEIDELLEIIGSTKKDIVGEK